MSNLTFPCLDPNSPTLPPPSPLQPICPYLFSSYRSRRKPKETTKQTTTTTTMRRRQSNPPDEDWEELYRAYGADERRIPELLGLGNPYYHGVTAWRIWTDRLKKEAMQPKKRGSGRWMERYRPRSLDEFILHKEEALLLRQQVSQGVESHLIFEGPPGVGKKTMVWALLREAFGPDALKTREELKEFELKGEEMATIRVNVTFSQQHVEIDLSKCYGYEKHVITALVTESNSRAIVLYHANKLCADTQQYIRWIMERHEKCHKFIFICSDLSNLQSIKSICTVIRLLPPSCDEIFSFLEHIAEKEGVQLSQYVAQKIGKSSTYNIPQAIRLLESSSLAKHNSHQTISV